MIVFIMIAVIVLVAVMQIIDLWSWVVQLTLYQCTATVLYVSVGVKNYCCLQLHLECFDL